MQVADCQDTFLRPEQRAIVVHNQRHASDAQKSSAGLSIQFDRSFVRLRALVRLWTRHSAQPRPLSIAVREAGDNTNVALSPRSTRLRPSIRQRSNERRIPRNSLSVFI